jgi:hypothetical protein
MKLISIILLLVKKSAHVPESRMSIREEMRLIGAEDFRPPRRYGDIKKQRNMENLEQWKKKFAQVHN